MLKKTLPLVLIFLIAVVLRTYRLTEIPPGMTHDEANHGREAIGILDGDLRFYFPANYGSEPVYSYSAAASMLLLGENLLALRLVNVVFGLGAMGMAYVWAARAFDRQVALIAMGVTAVTFWPVASSREALRAGMLPFFMALAVWFLWQIVFADKATKLPRVSAAPRLLVIFFAISIAITLHIYLAARVTWLIFPVFLVYLALFHRGTFKVAWRPVLVGLVLAGLLIIPMFVYLQNNPEAQTRLTMLDGPLQSIREGDFVPVLSNAAEALLAFVWSGFGDQFLAYNIPGRPVFDLVTAVFFTIGLLVTIWRWQQPNYSLLLLWFGIGIVPSLLTGATANTTRNLAALPAVMLLPAVGFATVMEGLKIKGLKIKEWQIAGGFNLESLVIIVWLIFAGTVTARDYFVRWGELPEVRGAYQHTLVEGLAFLEVDAGERPLVISSVYPGPAHDPSISLVLSPEVSAEARWVDARFGLIFPGGGNGRILIPASTPIHPTLAQFVEEVTAVSLRPDDLDPGFKLYELNSAHLDQFGEMKPINFANAVLLRAAQWQTKAAHPGEVAEILTIWEVVDPQRVGPLVLPFFTTDVTLFTQVLDESVQVMAQRDSLEAPSWDWQAGDIIVQIHPVAIPAEAAPGDYRTIVGLYDKLSGERRPVITPDGSILETFAEVPLLQITVP